MKNYKIKLGGLEVAYLWNEGKDGKKGYYTVALVKSYKDKDGNWKDSKIYLDADDAVVLGRMLARTEQVALQIETFDKNN